MNDIRLTPQLSTLILNIKKYISQKKLSLDEFLYEVKLSNPKRITQQQFGRIVQRINELGQPINVSMLFTQLSKGSAVIARQTFISSFFKVFKIDRIHLQGQSMCLKPKGFKIQEKIANPFEQQAKRKALFGFTRLKHNILNKRQKLDKIFSDCDINKSGFIDKIQLNKLLFASGIKQFKDKDIRRYLVHYIFEEMLKKQQMSRPQFFQLFQEDKTPKTKSIRGSVKAVKVTRGGTESTPKQRKGTQIYIKISNQPGNYYINPQEDYLDDPYNYDPFGYDYEPQVRPKDPRIRPDPFDYDPRIRPDPFDQYDNPKILPKRPKVRPIDPYDLPYDLPYDPTYDPQYDDYQGNDQYFDNPKIKPKRPKIKPIDPYNNPKPIDPYNNPKPKRPTNNLEPHPKFQIKNNVQNNVKAYPNAGKYYRLGIPSEQDKPYLQELQRLLSSNKTYQDPKNPKTPGQYVTAKEIFDNEPFQLIDMSSEEMNSERKNLKIGNFIEANDVIQGQTGDCFFLCVIGSIAAQYPQLLSQLFLFEVNPASYYGVRLFIDGEWSILKTDDLFACKPYGGQIFYAKPNNNEIWVMLLQKCYAKVYGSFKAIDGGQQYEAFFILTGAPSIFIDFKTEKNERFLKDRIISAEKSGYLMATAGTDYLSSLSEEQRNEIGLVQGHAYSMILIKQVKNTTLVKMRNPWGKFQWKGDWSYDSPLWTEQLRKQLGYTSKYQDGTFFMSWEDYYQYFGIITICKVNPLHVHTSLRMVNNNHRSNYVRMTVAKQGTYDIFISQEAQRKFRGQNYHCSRSRIIILRQGTNGKFEYVGAACQFLWPICSAGVKLSPGNYMISAKVSWEKWEDHECYLVAYGPERVTFQKVNRSIADQFKEGIFPGFAVANRQNAKQGSYADSGYSGIQTETYFSIKEGIGYIKTINKTKKAFSINITYQLGQLKIVVPKSNPYLLNIRPGQQDILGFFVGPMGYQFAFRYNIQVK